MSLITAIKSGNTVFVGVDSLICERDNLISVAGEENSKLWKVPNSNVIFAHVGQIINRNILSMADDIIDKEFEKRTIQMKDVVNAIVPEMIKLLETRGQLDDKNMTSSFILAHHDKLFHICGNGCVIEPSDDYLSDGSGATLADGAFQAIRGDKHLTPEQKIAKIISCACTRHAYVGYPIRIINTANDDVIIIRNEVEAAEFVKS